MLMDHQSLRRTFNVLGTLLFVTLLLSGWHVKHALSEEIRIGVFEVDATTPVGSPLAYDIAKGVQTPLSCRGVVIVGSEKPIVLCAVDWIGIGNGGQDHFRQQLAEAVDTDTNRVAVHTLHQHDAPRCDFATDQLLSELGIENEAFDAHHAGEVVRRAAVAAKEAKAQATVATHYGIGVGTVEMVASNRRILGKDGRVQYTRWTATRDPEIRAFPAGTIDPQLKMLSFWAGEKSIVALTYYATHPQSYYRTGLASPDFPGLARNARSSESGVLHVHFNGAGGNIGAGKWNDGAKENRQVLADRVAAGMSQAWEATKKFPLSAKDLRWATVAVRLPPAAHLDEQQLLKIVHDSESTAAQRYFAAERVVWLRRCAAGKTIDISCLRIAQSRILHLPGELFVEYQLAAQQMRPKSFVAMAAYGDYGPWYIGTEIAYGQGGYETSARASNVAPAAEKVLLSAIAQLLGE